MPLSRVPNTCRRACTKNDISLASFFDIKANTCNDASLKLAVESSALLSCSDAGRVSIRWESELPMRPACALALNAFDIKSSVTRH